jgi:hypothetical protein
VIGEARADKADLIKWRDALDAICGDSDMRNMTKGLRIARECSHPDAQWLCSIFPNKEIVTHQEMLDVMSSQDDDMRALHILGELSDVELLHRAAERGYAPSQAALAARRGGLERLR